MGTVFIAIADSVRARIYAQEGRGAPLRLVDELHHAEGGMHNRDLVTDRAGHPHASTRGTSFAGAHAPPKEVEQHAFAHDVAARLEKARASGEADELVLVMGPRMLGSVKRELKDATQRKIALTIESDIAHLDENKIADHLREKWFFNAKVFSP